ncbi:MAG: Na+/H+ antiporter NhaC family protein [Prevotellaceae bacterium]|nr:Na+/H+ antiporter NhaC family protein [Prevotellaceae bacterium]MDY3365904.1 Na+/H+ antiporter NhaC family protein [Prevotella sp.]
MIKHTVGLKALSPIFFFIIFYVTFSIAIGDFYKIPITVAFMFSSIYAVAITSKISFKQRIKTFSKGATSENMTLMLWIFIMAGAFAQSAKEMGSIEATVHLALNILPGNLLLAGLFLSACIISMSIGTSVGTIVALTPIAAMMGDSTGYHEALLVGTVVGGSLFGDNLSFISDTTVAATSTQGCNMKDKFMTNIYIAVPAAITILGIYFAIGKGLPNIDRHYDVAYLNLIPYLIVLITAIAGLNVLIVLALGIAMTGFIGIYMGAYDFYGWLHSMGNGMTGMGELMIITMLAGGLLELISLNGGIQYIVERLTQRIKGKRGAELSIAALVSLVDLCTANNTVAILTVGGISKSISEKFHIDPRKSASILDTMSCAVQGVIPYGAQVLMAAGLANISPLNITPYLFYPFAIGAFTVLAILFRYPGKNS